MSKALVAMSLDVMPPLATKWRGRTSRLRTISTRLSSALADRKAFGGVRR